MGTMSGRLLALGDPEGAGAVYRNPSMKGLRMVIPLSLGRVACPRGEPPDGAGKGKREDETPFLLMRYFFNQKQGATRRGRFTDSHSV